MGHLKNGEFYQAVGDCGRALELDMGNTKALYRKASGQNNGSEFKEARETLQTLLEIEPGNAAAKQMLQEVARKEKQAKDTAKKAAMKMVAGMARDPRVPLSTKEQTSQW